MTPEQYRKLLGWYEHHPKAKKLTLLLNHWLPAIPFVCFPLLIVLLNIQWFGLFGSGTGRDILDFMPQIARAILVPAVVFLFGTLLRAKLDRPRPYEQPGFTPLVEKETSGHSFPSRHALSAAVLAADWLYFYPPVGVGMLLIALAICVLRVLAGVHFIRDVVAGAVLGFVLGYAGMWLL